MIELHYQDGKLFFKDYANRDVSIVEDDYLDLISSPERQEIRPCLEECLLEPSEVWWVYETIDNVEYSYYKYIKLYSDLVFVAYVINNDLLNFTLNNFYAYNEHSFSEAEKERTGQLIKSNLKY